MAVGRRINVIGCSGSGKSTLARTLAARLELEFIELDSFQHQENWRTAKKDEFLELVHEAIKSDGWVIDGNYSMIRPTVWPLVDTIIWLDYPFLMCLWRVWQRTAWRWVKREVLWNGNREHLWWHFFSRNSLLLWVITSHSKKKRECTTLFTSAELRSKNLVQLRSPRETAEWLATLEQPGPKAENRIPDKIHS